MKTKLWNNPKRSVTHLPQSRLDASTSSSSIMPEVYTEETQFMNSQRPSLLERMRPLSLRERLSNPTSPCSTTGTASAPSVTRTSNEKRPKKGSTIQMPAEKGINEWKEMTKTSMTLSVVNQSTDDRKSTQTSSPGPCPTEWRAAHYETSAPQPETSSPTTPSTSSLPKHTSLTQGLHPSSPTQSGNHYYRVSPSTLMRYSAGDTLLNMTPNSPMTLGTSQSQPKRLPRQKQSKLQEIGSLPGTKPQRRQPLLSRIGAKNSKNTAGTFSTCLPLSQKNTTDSFSTMTEPYANELPCAETSYSRISPSLATCESNSSMSEVLTRDRKRKRTPDGGPQSDLVIPVCDGTAASVPPQRNAAFTNTSVLTAELPTMSTAPAQTSPKRAQTVGSVARPIKHPRPLYWEGNVEGISRLALISESLRPLPSVPDDELKNEVMTRTISENEHLFSIVTSINIERLTSL